MRPHSAASLFTKNIRSAHTCLEVFDQMPAPTTDLNTRWILRAAVVFVVSALDTYYHDKVKYRVRRCYRAGSLPTQLASFKVPLGELEKWEKAYRRGNVVRNWVMTHLARQSLQSPDSIADALKLVGINDYWGTIAGSSTQTLALKTQWNGLIRRRNQITHEGDRQQSRCSGKKLRPIDPSTVEKYIRFAEKLVEMTERAFPR